MSGQSQMTDDGIGRNLLGTWYERETRTWSCHKPQTMSDPNLSQFRLKRKYRPQKLKRGTEYVYELRDVPDGNLVSNPVACSNNVVENAVASEEKIPKQISE